MTCRACIHCADCMKDETTQYYATEIACNNVEELCTFFKNKADFVEVIRCGKCRFRNTDGFCFKNINGVGYKKVSADDYCSSGKGKGM